MTDPELRWWTEGNVLVRLQCSAAASRLNTYAKRKQCRSDVDHFVGKPWDGDAS